MSLKGSLQTVALPEVLNFLSDTGKSGEFHVSGGHGDGRIWFHEGRISGFQAARAQRPFEAIFELLRISEGEFDFAAGAERPEDACVADDGDLSSALEAAQARLAEWNDIVRVVPSLSHRLELRAEAPADSVLLEPEQWLLVVAIGAGRSVGEVIDHRGQQEFDGCKAVRELVDASLVDVLEPVADEPPVEEMVAEEACAEDPVVVEPAVEEPVAFEAEAEEPVPFDLAAFDVVPEAPVADPVAPEYGGFGFSSFNGFSAQPQPVDEVHDDQDADVEGAHFAHESPEAGDDHYAALRAAMVEIGENLVVDGEDQPHDDEQNQPVYEFEPAPAVDSRAALQALLHEVAGPEGTDDSEADARYDEAIDGLADRGPWTQHELAVMDSGGGWGDDPAEETADGSNIVPFAPVHQNSEESQMAGEGAELDEDLAEDAEEEQPAEEPINRGLLLKFLSSVRN